MQLVQVRVRGLAPLSESRWFELGAGLNLFGFSDKIEGPSSETAGSFFQNLQTINPPYEVQAVKPFAKLQQEAKAVKQGDYTRRIALHKRTVAMAVFSATPHLVQELATINDHLYETDRIEVGRRLDYSRWINFVELASSSRWSEISEDISKLLDQADFLGLTLSPYVLDVLQQLKPTDRIKEQLLEDLVSWLQNLPSKLQEKSGELIANILLTVMRASHFHTAKKIVRQRLPLFVLLDGYVEPTTDISEQILGVLPELLQPGSDFQKTIAAVNRQLPTLQFPGIALQLNENAKTPDALSIIINNQSPSQLKEGHSAPLRQLQAKAMLAIARSRLSGKADPIFLFTAPHETLAPALHFELREFVLSLSKQYQCLYSFNQNKFFTLFAESDADKFYKKSTNNQLPLPMEIDA